MSKKTSAVPVSSGERAVILLQAAILLHDLANVMDATEGTSIFSTLKVRTAAETAERLGNDYAELAKQIYEQVRN